MPDPKVADLVLEGGGVVRAALPLDASEIDVVSDAEVVKGNKQVGR